MYLPQVINQIEGVISKRITFCDIRTEWFVELDDSELSFIDTLLYANTCALHLHKDMHKKKRHMCDAKISKNYLMRLNVELDKERVPVVCS
jgi:hypothetical protein